MHLVEMPTKMSKFVRVVGVLWLFCLPTASAISLQPSEKAKRNRKEGIVTASATDIAATAGGSDLGRIGSARPRSHGALNLKCLFLACVIVGFLRLVLVMDHYRDMPQIDTDWFMFPQATEREVPAPAESTSNPETTGQVPYWVGCGGLLPTNLLMKLICI